MYFEGCIYMETLRDRIRTLAKTKGLSLPKLEAELGFGSGTIVKWEKASPSADKLQKVADYFDVSVDYLLGREPSDETQEMLEYLHKNPEMRVLLSSSAKLEKEDLEAVVAIVRRMNKEHDLE